MKNSTSKFLYCELSVVSMANLVGWWAAIDQVPVSLHKLLECVPESGKILQSVLKILFFYSR